VSTLFIMKFILVLLCVIAVQLVGAEKDNPCSIDAAVTYTNDKIYFFKGDKYGRYDDDDDDDRKIAALSPISAWTGVPNDIDAVVKYRGNFYFFKGCYYYIFDVDADKVTYKRNINAWKAPCNLDSAFSWGDHVYLLKGNDYYEWEKEDGESAVWHGKGNIKDKFGVEGPFDAVVQWDENDYHYFFKGEYYWRLRGGSLRDKSPITYWKGMIDEGANLLKDCPCSCSRISHKDAWKLKKVDYDVDNSNVIKYPPTILKRIVQDYSFRDKNGNFPKCNKECSTTEYIVKKTITETRKFASTTGVGLKIGTTIETGLPGLVGGKVSVEASIEQKFTYGKDNTQSVVRTQHFKCPGYSGAITTCTVSIQKERIEVPYTMTFQHKKKGCICHEKGTYVSQTAGSLMQKVAQAKATQA